LIFLNPTLALLGQGLKKSPIGQKLDFANHPYLCKGFIRLVFGVSNILNSHHKCKIAKWVKSGFLMIVPIYAKVSLYVDPDF
jgi:hypothetical protein